MDNILALLMAKKGGGVNATAQAGQTIVVEEVDESGKPTKWKAADYQPRTHWAEIEELVNEAPTYSADDGMFFYSTCPSLVVGETYIVTYNGTRYACVAVDTGEGMIVLGNMVIEDSEMSNTGEPFLLCTQEGMLISMDAYGATEITVKITKEQYNTIPPHYLPKTHHVIEVNSDDVPSASNSRVQIKLPYDTTELVEDLKRGLPVYLRISGQINQTITLTTWMLVGSIDYYINEGMVSNIPFVLYGFDPQNAYRYSLLLNAAD